MHTQHTTRYQTQADLRLRAVSLANLLALCARASGVCHRYTVDAVSRSRARVTYSNPDEYGTEHPVTAIFPVVPNPFEVSNPYVVVGQTLRIVGAGADEDCFDPIVNGPSLYRSRAGGTDWQTRAEVSGDRYVCPDGQTRAVDWGHPYTNETFAAFEVTREMTLAQLQGMRAARHWAYFTWSALRPVSGVRA